MINLDTKCEQIQTIAKTKHLEVRTNKVLRGLIMSTSTTLGEHVWLSNSYHDVTTIRENTNPCLCTPTSTTGILLADFIYSVTTLYPFK
jgi:hypothetical protein